eukprot:6409711-Amphidinium_carterae.1
MCIASLQCTRKCLIYHAVSELSGIIAHGSDEIFGFLPKAAPVSIAIGVRLVMLAYLRLLDCLPSLAATPGELADPAARAWLEFGWTI